MTRNLVIVESPAKARTIERYLGQDYTVLASYGHVRDLPENPGKGKLGVDVEVAAILVAKEMGLDVAKYIEPAKEEVKGR